MTLGTNTGSCKMVYNRWNTLILLRIIPLLGWHDSHFHSEWSYFRYWILDCQYLVSLTSLNGEIIQTVSLEQLGLWWRSWWRDSESGEMAWCLYSEEELVKRGSSLVPPPCTPSRNELLMQGHMNQLSSQSDWTGCMAYDQTEWTMSWSTLAVAYHLRFDGASFVYQKSIGHSKGDIGRENRCMPATLAGAIGSEKSEE